MSKVEARVLREKLERVQEEKAEVFWNVELWIMLLEACLRIFGSLTAEELKKLDENRLRLAFVKRLYVFQVWC